jgi:hypothetical protein
MRVAEEAIAMMQRRAFVTGMAGVVTGALMLAPRLVHAQRTKPPVIGVLGPWGPSLNPGGQREPSERGLRELGWTPNSTIVIEQRYADASSGQLFPATMVV